MKFSRADRRILIESPVETTDSMGGVSVAWEELTTVWAERRNLKGRELVEAGAMSAEITAVFSIRSGPAVTEKCRITDRGSVFDILVVLPVPGGRPERLDLYVKGTGE